MREKILKGSTDYLIYEGQSDYVLKPAGRVSLVLKGFSLPSKTPVIVKKLASHVKNKEVFKAHFKREAKFNFDHPGVPKVLDYIEQEGEVYIVKEYYPGLDLKQFQSLNKLRRKESLLFYVNCIIEALKILEPIHEAGYTHADLRPSNILVAHALDQKPEIHQPEIKLIDFAVCRFPGENYVFAKHQPFVLYYSAPEMVMKQDELINPYCDIYSLGMTLFMLINPNRYRFFNNPEVIANLQTSFQLRYDFKMPYELYSILRKATNKKVFLRPPNRYTRQELHVILQEGQRKRYRSAALFRHDLEKFAEKYQNNRLHC